MIYKDKYDYAVYDFVDGIPKYYGSYNSLVAAENVDNHLNKFKSKKEPKRSVEYYLNPVIYEKNGKYIGYKNYRGKTYCIGTFNTYDELIKKYVHICTNGFENWIKQPKPKKLPKYIYKTAGNTYGIHKYDGKKQVYYGSYKTLEEAKKMVKKLEDNNWNKYKAEIE